MDYIAFFNAVLNQELKDFAFQNIIIDQAEDEELEAVQCPNCKVFTVGEHQCKPLLLTSGEANGQLSVSL